MANQTHDSTAKTQAQRPPQGQAEPQGQPLELESPGAAAQRAQSALPEALSPKDVLALQRIVGNQGVRAILSRRAPAAAHLSAWQPRSLPPVVGPEEEEEPVEGEAKAGEGLDTGTQVGSVPPVAGESAEDHAKGGSPFDQRPAVRRVLGDSISPAAAQPEARAESRFVHDFRLVQTRTDVSQQAIQRAAPTGPPQCGPSQLFTELKMPFYLSNQYYRGSEWMEKGSWKSFLAAVRKGQCTAKGKFENIKLKWDLGNPKLGSFWGVNINKNEIEFDIIAHVIYARSRHGKKCGDCFTGTASWSFNVTITRKKGGKVETGRTARPIKGSVSGEKCDGTQCCAIDELMKVSLIQRTGEITAQIDGEVKVKGATYSG